MPAHLRSCREGGQFTRICGAAGLFRRHPRSRSFLGGPRPISFPHRPRRGAVRSARQAHNLEVVGSNPTAATSDRSTESPHEQAPATTAGALFFAPRGTGGHRAGSVGLVLSLDRWTPAEQFRGGVAWPGSKPRAAIARGYESRAAEFVGRLVLAPGARVLDVPCGTGNLALPAARAGADVTGVDIDIGSSSPSVSETSPRSGRTTSCGPGELAGAGPLSRPSSHSPRAGRTTTTTTTPPRSSPGHRESPSSIRTTPDRDPPRLRVPDLTTNQALSEYAPGRLVVINKLTYRSAGVAAAVPAMEFDRGKPLFDRRPVSRKGSIPAL